MSVTDGVAMRFPGTEGADGGTTVAVTSEDVSEYSGVC
jgi:hypothetical protein